MRPQIRAHHPRLVEQFRDALSAEHREVLLASYGETYEVAAAELNIKVGTLKSRLNRARNKLQALWDASKHPNGQPMYAADGTLLNDRGERSVFDDVAD